MKGPTNKMAPPPLTQSNAARSESSVLFSLSELMDLESERLLEEESARREQARAQARARELEERKLREVEEERLRLADEARRRADLRRREEEARFAAIALAELEKARHQAESEARLHLLAQSQEHEQKLLCLREDRAKRRLRRLVVASLVVSVAVGVGGYAWVSAAKRETEAKVAQMQLEATERRRILEERIEGLTRKMNQLGAAESNRRQQMQREIDVLRKQQDVPSLQTAPSRGDRTTRPRLPQPPAAIPSGCQEGDPMCPL